MNRQQRRGYKNQIQKGIRESWQNWEWRTPDRNHPLTPSGVIKCCLNNIYSVQFYQQQTDWGLVDHLVIRRHDGKPIFPWKDGQRIKNELLGKDRVAVQVFPEEDKLVDEVNLYHLFVLPKKFKLPFGLNPGWLSSKPPTIKGSFSKS